MTSERIGGCRERLRLSGELTCYDSKGMMLAIIGLEVP
jgi:hypothetical protein